MVSVAVLERACDRRCRPRCRCCRISASACYATNLLECQTWVIIANLHQGDIIEGARCARHAGVQAVKEIGRCSNFGYPTKLWFQASCVSKRNHVIRLPYTYITVTFFFDSDLKFRRVVQIYRTVKPSKSLLQTLCGCTLLSPDSTKEPKVNCFSVASSPLIYSVKKNTTHPSGFGSTPRVHPEPDLARLSHWKSPGGVAKFGPGEGGVTIPVQEWQRGRYRENYLRWTRK